MNSSGMNQKQPNCFTDRTDPNSQPMRVSQRWCGCMKLVVIGLLACSLLGCGGSKGTSQAPSLKDRYEQALKVSDPGARARRMIDIARDYVRQNNAIGADPAMEAAEQAAGSADQQRERADLYLELFAVKALAGDAEHAGELLKKATRAAREVESPSEQFPLQIQLAKAYARDMQKVNSAKGAVKKAASLVETLPAEQQFGANVQLGVVSIVAEEAEQGEALLTNATDSVESLEGRERCEGLGDLAAAMLELDRPEDAQAQLDAAAAAADSLKDAEAKAHAFISLGRKLMLAGEEGQSKAFFQRASSAAESVGDPNMRTSIMEQISALKLMVQ